MVFKRWAIHSSVDWANSTWIVFWSFASVSTSTLLVASSCQKKSDQLPSQAIIVKLAYQNNDFTILHKRPTQGEELLLPGTKVGTLKRGEHNCKTDIINVPSSPTTESRLNLFSAAVSTAPFLGKSQARWRADMSSASVRSPKGSLWHVCISIVAESHNCDERNIASHVLP